MTKEKFPLLPLRDVVVYPHMVIPLFVGRDKSIQALESAMEGDKKILLVAQKNAATDEPSEVDVYKVGTVATVLQLLKLPDGTVKVLVEGLYRAEVTSFEKDGDFYLGEDFPLEFEAVSEKEEEVLV
jgi:ATP-dependent Lon protease